MKAGDLVMWKWKGEVSSYKMGVIVSDYTESLSKDGSVLKNVYWFDHSGQTNRTTILGGYQ